MKLINSIDRNPDSPGTYFVMIKDESNPDDDAFRSTALFTLGFWEVPDENYVVLQWVDGSNDERQFSEKRIREAINSFKAPAWNTVNLADLIIYELNQKP